ncbi:uncharacterized protein LOC129922103 [Biomphalaria glabrata]|uniref:Uncharacterized protein LOC129922103 n=1 Tax=Biomphalaria glabrata TaxID=6526 RepID=A0A9W2YIZ2_BIOGL|nr:uncharacterized protein LOC129922103 [Biomphalaria glabrata]
MSPLFSQTLDQDWLFYNVRIGTQGEPVHPFPLLETTVKPDNRSPRKFNFPTKMEEAFSPVGMILTLYRLGRLRSSEIMVDYVTQIINKANSAFVGKPWSAKPQLNANSLTCSSWWNNKDFKRAVAAYDMFFFLNSPQVHSLPLDFGSLVTSNEDCVLVTLISYVPRALHLQVKSDIVTLIFEPRAVDEMTKMFSQEEEISQLDSYFSYGKAMSIIDRSYFSATCNPHLYTYLDGLFIGRKDKTGLNANKLEGIGHSDVLNLAFFVSYALWDRSDYCQEIIPYRGRFKV